MIGLFGGTFDPVHNGHLRTALDVFEALELTELRFLPLGQAVHREQPLTPPEQRLALLKAAIGVQPGFRVDERELRRERPSYTVHTLEDLRDELGPAPALCLLLGRDAFNAFHTWHKPERILELAHLVVMDRPGHGLPDAPELRELMEGRVARDGAELKERAAGVIWFQPVTRLDISSSDIRRRLARGRSIRWLVPDSILSLLQQQEN
ncbi:nicotinate-nucleotide adenylyltransferase [Thiolapillus brandeum]|uniref:Probable nicotinate-nucleotide adenylyltransferase n=1 Tax=Thiolapillus brandeum TaxID=1076588 RepID=A0A7U6JIT5_9GAMM|nr:nicotinate-nucleotide adenylyltransferase [Thiolapillus brandeum]BAO45636.1 nicotinate-nucleotide adenylyltransferase [Thiolapillus brandeum]